MQKYAEEAVKEHIGGTIQPNFLKTKNITKFSFYE